MIGSSQSIGADDEISQDHLPIDDEISQDHQWGPGFTIWLSEEDFVSVGVTLTADLHQAVPDSFLGYEIDKCFGSKAKSVRVRSIDQFFKEETDGFAHPPDDVTSWNPTPRDESHLYFIKHGHVFHDPYGEFTRRKEGFSHWPRYTLLQKIANASWQLWHYGEYNFDRVAKRGDPIALLLCKAEFIHHAMRLCFYLEEDFVPYWKWVSYCFRQISGVGCIARDMDLLNASIDVGEQKRHIESICAALRTRMAEKGVISESDTKDWGQVAVNEELQRLRSELAATSP